MTAKKPSKNCAARSEVLFLFLFSRYCRCCGCVGLDSSVTMLNNSWHATISLEKPISAGTNTQAQPLWQMERNFLADILSFKLDG